MMRATDTEAAKRIADKYISRDGVDVGKEPPAPAPADDPPPVEPVPVDPPGDDGKPGDGGAGLLKSFIERIQRMEAEKKTIVDDIKEIYSEAKGTGFDTSVLKKIIADLAKDPAKLQEFQAVYDVYMAAIGGHAFVKPAVVDQATGIYTDLKAISDKLKHTRMARGVTSPYSTHISAEQWLELQADFARRFPTLFGGQPITLDAAAKHFHFQRLELKG